MLPSTCSHARSLPASLCSICTNAAPEPLLDLCFSYIVTHLDTICDVGPFSHDYKLKDGLVLPVEICERLLHLRQRAPSTPLDNSFVNIFRDKLATRLKRVKLRNALIDDAGFRTIVRHKLVELEVDQCQLLTENSLGGINAHGEWMISLRVGEGVNIWPARTPGAVYGGHYHSCTHNGSGAGSTSNSGSGCTHNSTNGNGSDGSNLTEGCSNSGVFSEFRCGMSNSCNCGSSRCSSVGVSSRCSSVGVSSRCSSVGVSSRCPSVGVPSRCATSNQCNCGSSSCWTPILHTPRLQRLTLKGLTPSDSNFYPLLLLPLTNLIHLDLSDCGDLGTLSFLPQLSNLNSLVLYNVEGLQEAIAAICQLKHLRHLDISQSRERSGKYRNENQVLGTLVERLPRLVSLDISGTNLAGTGVAEYSPGKGRGVPASDIPGLSSRVRNPFQFLGLYGTAHGACQRHDIPAKMISGDANEEQILVAATAYNDRADVLQRVLNDLYHLFRFETCEHTGHALTVVLDSMDRHIAEKHIQISGSATLFYIVKGKEKNSINVRVKRRIISALLNGMFAHKADETMMRNGCLTLCQFKIPQDVLFEYERLVNILLHSVYGMEQEGFVQRIGIYLLNSLACQVDGVQKQKLGDLGAISKMIWLISDRLSRGVCDDVLEVAWSTMWNVTDETPRNCHRFLEEKGMEFFLKCLDRFPDKEELLRNMMGLLGNVAEVKSLRPYLMTREYLTVFSDLLDSASDGIEVSYNAAGVISHMASDGAAVWTVREPSRAAVLRRMVAAIERWDLNTERNINYRSFEPILYLVRTYETPECQHWAVWALANLTKVYPDKYCSLVESEGGLHLLEELLSHESPPARVKQLAAIVIENCRHYREIESLDSDSQLDG